MPSFLSGSLLEEDDDGGGGVKEKALADVDVETINNRIATMATMNTLFECRGKENDIGWLVCVPVPLSLFSEKKVGWTMMLSAIQAQAQVYAADR